MRMTTQYNQIRDEKSFTIYLCSGDLLDLPMPQIDRDFIENTAPDAPIYRHLRALSIIALRLSEQEELKRKPRK